MTRENARDTSDFLKVHHASEQQLAAYDQWFHRNEERHLRELADLVAIPTLAMDSAHAGDLIRAAEYLKAKLTAIGMEKATIHPADGLPLVTAEWMGAEGQPTVLFYGHFDVQPAEPSSWQSDPWTADIRDDKLYGRGASDDTGPVVALISTIEALMELDGGLPVNVMFLLDGAEEVGSLSMPKWLEDNKSWVARPDYGVSVDAMMHSDDQGLMWKGLRGVGDVQVTVKTAKSDQHSGIFGGVLPNAALVAAKIIDSMWNDDGSIAIEGWSDGQTDLSAGERAEIAQASEEFDEAAVLEDLEASQFIGEANYSVLERTWIRSAIDVTGIKGGYIEGSASVIPHSVWFRIMIRTGPGHETATLIEKIKNHIKKHTPWNTRIEMTSLDAGNAIFVSEDDLNFSIVRNVLAEFFGQEPKILYVGGGVPALSHVPEAGGPNLVTCGFQRADENFHADDEYMRLPSFRKSQRVYARLLHAMVDQPKR